MTLAVIPIIVRIESNKEKVFFIYAELSRNDIDDRKRNIRVFFAKLRQSTQNPGGSLFYEKSSRLVSSKLVTRRFSNREGEPGQHSNNMPDGAGRSGVMSRLSGISGGGGQGLVRQTVRGNIANESGRSRGAAPMGSLLHPQADVDYEEDLQAEIMKQREEQEAAAFKKFFHGRIKAMSCMKKVKHVALVLMIAAIVAAYFLIKRSMISDIETAIHESLDYYRTFSNRDLYLGQLLSEYRESFVRNLTFPSPQNDTNQTSIDYFLQHLLDNEKDFNQLR